MPPARPRPSLLRLLTLAAVVCCGACSPAGVVTTEASGALDAARQAVAEAEMAGAATVAPTELRAATLRLERAERAAAAGDAVGAERLAREAALAARLADVTVLARRADGAGSLYRELRALRAEVDRALGR